MSERRCGICGRDPAAGFASIGDQFYCHGDDDPEPTCYMRASWEPPVVETKVAIDFERDVRGG